jgi:hypothetical protein
MLIHSSFQVIKNNIFAIEGPMYSTSRVTSPVEEILHCYNVAEEDREDEHPRNL